jgi:hypothetical protein
VHGYLFVYWGVKAEAKERKSLTDWSRDTLFI